MHNRLVEHKLDQSEIKANVRALKLIGFKFDRNAMNLSISHITCLLHYYDGDTCTATLMVFTDLRKMCWYR